MTNLSKYATLEERAIAALFAVRLPRFEGLFNVSSRRVGGIRFTKIGRLTISTSISKRVK